MAANPPTGEDLYEEERQRFERASDLYFDKRKNWAKSQRSGREYGDSVLLNISWSIWRLAVGLIDPDAPPPEPVDDTEHNPLDYDDLRP